MTVSILKALAALPSGKYGPDLSMAELAHHLKESIGGDGEKARNAEHAIRDELYRDGGVDYMKTVIGEVFRDEFVRDQRRKMVPFARFNNVSKRLVNELSTVYAEPAKRYVADAAQAAYSAVLEAVRIDEQMLQASRLLNLHRALLVGFRVRQGPDDSRVPVLDIATPAHVRAVLSPSDPTVVLGWAIRTGYSPARKLVDLPAWTLWTDHERIFLRDDMSPIADSYFEHGFGVCPWVPVTLGPPSAGFWPGSEGADISAAHVSGWLTNVLLLKETKSATKQSVIQGDTTSSARGQAADSEVPIELGDGTSVSTVDMSMDLGAFRDVANHILETAANNYGMSAALVTHQGVQSAEARELMRVPLREIRKQQQVPLRRFEQQLAVVMSKVLPVDLPEMAFDVDGWRIEFGESQTPLSGNEEMDLFIKQRAAGITNTVEFLQSHSPGMDANQAEAKMLANISVETARVVAMRKLQAASGAMGSAAPDPNEPTTPQILGADDAADDNQDDQVSQDD
jgi:hypothetical protein